MTPIACNYPIIARDKVDFQLGNDLSASISPIRVAPNVRSIEQKLTGKNLVRDLILDQKARFACLIDSPWCAYRGVDYGNPDLLRSEENQLSFIQHINVESTDYSSPVFLHTFVVTTEDVQLDELLEKHGVTDLWLSATAIMPKGSKIAIGPYFTSEPTTTSILRITKAKEGSLVTGSFRVSDVPEEGFYFRVDVEATLFHQLRNATESLLHCNSIYCFALSQGFDILRDRYSKKDEWNEHLYLRQLRKVLKNAGALMWEDENFDSNQAVAKILPHQIQIEGLKEDLNIADSVEETQ